jgi:hypothetical protein
MDLEPVDDLSPKIRLHHEAAQTAATTAVEHAVEAGRLLTQAKTLIPHGRWLPYLAEIGITARQAQRYMQIERHLPNATRASHLSVRGALAEIAEPKASRSILSRPREEIAKYAAWYDLEMAFVLLLFADGLDIDAITIKTGFDRHEVACIVSPQIKSLSAFLGWREATAPHKKSERFFAYTDAMIHKMVAEMMIRATECAIRQADAEERPHTKLALEHLRRQWETRAAETAPLGLEWLAHTHPDPLCDRNEKLAVITLARQAIGLDRDWDASLWGIGAKVR